MNYQTLKGFRDFLPAEKRKRDFVLQKIVAVFERFGFDPIETPTLEYAALLLGKYGTEADKLVYTFQDEGGREVGLKYDQTVPTARMLAQYQQELPKYFRRYQIQNVFRAEKPQRGRFREFTQCDIDIFGAPIGIADAEILACAYFALTNIGFNNIQLLVNDRATLVSNLSPFANDRVNVFSIIQSIDKSDKVPQAEIVAELVKKGMDSKKAELVLNSIGNATPSDTIEQIMQLAQSLGVPPEALKFQPTLARGLDYYTGMITEMKIGDYTAGSVGGGGRYDELIEQLGGASTPAVGIAFGFDRLVEAADQLGILKLSNVGTQVLVTIFNDSLTEISMQLTNQLRASGISAEIVVNSTDKLEKQLKYADRKGIPYVVIVGPDEANKGTVILKNLTKKSQEEMTIEEVIRKLK